MRGFLAGELLSLPRSDWVVWQPLRQGHENYEEFAQLEQRNTLLRKNIPQDFVQYDAIIFHEGDLKPEFQERLARRLSNLQFRDIHELWQSGKAVHDRVCSKTVCNTGI
jgi:hypothetical protein